MFVAQFLSLVVISITLMIMTWFFFVEDKFLLKVNNIVIDPNSLEIREGDILRVGVSPDGSVAAHWLGRTLHHYVLVLNIDGSLWVAHTWYKKLFTNNNIHIPPSYQIQPLNDFILHSKMFLYEVFRNPNQISRTLTMDQVKNIITEFGSSVRCYITIMKLYNVVYPEENMFYSKIANSRLIDYWLISFFLFKPMWFEMSLIRHGFERYGIYKFVKHV